MKKARLLCAACAFTHAVLSTSINASPVIHARLNPGDSCHYFFASLTTRDATSPKIAHYDAHAQAALRRGGL